jgi:hypothetical protein
MPTRGKRPNYFTQGPVAKAYRPTMRDQAGSLLSNVLGNTYQGNRIARNVFGSSGLGGGQGNLLGGLGLLDLTPIGAAFALEEAGRQIGGGQPVTGAANVALGMVPIPGAARAAKGGAKALGRALAGKPSRIVGYHGTNSDFVDFALPGKAGMPTGGRKSGGNAVYVAESPETANYFARGDGANVRKVMADVQVFDPSDPEHLAMLEPFVRKNFGAKVGRGALYGPDAAMEFLRNGDYGLLEQPAVEKYLKSRGFGAVRMQEQPGKATWAVFDPSIIQPAPFGKGSKP